MGITVRDPDGGTHTFPDGTPDSVINAEMERRWSSRGQPQAPQPKPLTTPDKLPPGANPGTISAKPGSVLEADMVPLSADAQRGLRMIAGGGATNNRAMEQAGRLLVDKDPTYQARTAQVKAIGDAAGKRQAARLAGENIFGSFAKLLHTFNEADDDALEGAIGPYAASPYMGKMPLVGGMTPPQAAAAYGDHWANPLSWMSGAKDADKSWNLQNLFSHDVHGITNALVSAAGSGVKMSDARQEMFDSAMRDFMKSTNRKDARKILDHAMGIIANDFHITPQESKMLLENNLKRIKAEAREKQEALTLRAAEVPPDAVQLLLQNAKNKKYRTDFNKTFNDGEEGLAEILIKSADARTKKKQPQE